MRRIMLACLAVTNFFVISTLATAAKPAPKTTNFKSVECAGVYRHHLQGVCTDERSAIFWSFTTTLVKTDTAGKVLKKIEVGNHHGDLCYHDGKVYVAVNFGRFNDPEGKANSWVYVYKASDLSLLAKHETQQVFHGAGGIAYHDGKFIIVGGLPAGVEENYTYEYTPDFKFVKKHVIKSGQTRLGIQTAAFANGRWWFGCYGNKLLKTDKSFKMQGKYDFNCGLGIVGIGGGKFLIARGSGTGETRGGSLSVAVEDDKAGLVVVKE